MEFLIGGGGGEAFPRGLVFFDRVRPGAREGRLPGGGRTETGKM